ncbi:MAG TPA: bifunctional 3-(3-hydroxy-phenyl)propionate/3-hydroxycinnamic acid hydroxylase [Paracoccus sp. (in: a-proteobacteria)]|uniref:bifunctional 3-(3-hydroxy-phenyl)propionate/3-hydroxycinnamic acid hydroxylase n=1 Tax=Paracoccus sp. TaxID=267 RepID=UPI002CC82E85|nr:bifunctional 3-(3-hydroxy-phenyl)propionate/3-hydroxycinnamic acid hydroxylase [Paracoccus sp. (in: a-proteobacteria)]HWL55595.1 bifunctional 3-(3-hydroxy-phenyl)propionate/3-hydroxycinnamic acid hydroxylase [Paracoccus sp. (in: a-proteobacteria)]
MTTSSQFDAAVIIVGAGPAGTTLANLLGGYGVSTIVLEREQEIIDYPRAVGMDDEALRAFQTVDLAEPLLRDMIQNTLLRYHHSNGRMFAEVGPKAKPFGWPRRNLFIQPLSEKVIRSGIDRFDHVKILQGHEVIGLDQNEDCVTLTVRTADGSKIMRAPYVVGCDGGKSFIRKGLGIKLLGDTHPWRWLVVDLKNDDRFEPYSAIYCDPRNPYIVIDLPYGHRRFEFRLRPEDTDEKMSDPKEVDKLLRKRLGEDEKPEVIRARIYTHHSRIAESFGKGRVFIAGDAAHLQPPFFGQGLNSGLRDVMNLSWKLAMVTQGQAGPVLLQTYEQERKHHAEKMVKFATGIGKFYAPYSYLTEYFRKAFFWGVHRLPSLRDYVLQMKFKPMPFYERGVVDFANAGGKEKVGRMINQPKVADAEGRAMLLDNAIGKGFAVIGINEDPAAQLSAIDRAFVNSIGRLVQVNRSRRGTAGWQASPDTLVIDDLDGVFRDMLLKAPKQRFFILRPDRYVFAICDRDELSSSVDRLRKQLGRPATSFELAAE